MMAFAGPTIAVLGPSSRSRLGAMKDVAQEERTGIHQLVQVTGNRGFLIYSCKRVCNTCVVVVLIELDDVWLGADQTQDQQ